MDNDITAVNTPDTEPEDSLESMDEIASENIIEEVMKGSTATEDVESEKDSETDYERLAAEDLIALKGEFSELSAISSIAELENPLRYAALRDLGLTPTEAYLATRRRETRIDNRSHLESSVPRAASFMPGYMPESELRRARELFSDISDAEIKNLYKRVTQ